MRLRWSLGAAGVLAASLAAQTVDVGSGAPNTGIQMAFVNAWSRNGFYLLVGPPTTNVTPYGPAGYIQQFPALAPAKGTLALFKPDTTTNFNVLQMQAAMFAYYSSVGVGTAGYPTQDTLTCPTLASQPTNSCQWQPFASNYVLFAYSNLLANAAQNFAVRDPYYTKWNTFGGIYGLGPATSAETAVTGSAGSKATEQTYDAGAIYNITSGTLSGRLLAVKNPIYATYLSTGAHAGPLGLPATEELAQADGTFVQNFEGGAVQRDPKTGNVTVLPSVATIALTPAGPVQMNLGDTLAVTASLYSSAGSPLTGRSVGWNTSNGRVVSIQSNGLQATLTAVGGGTASVTVTSGGKTSPPLSVSVSAPCCQIGEGAPTPAIQQSFQSAVTRNGLSVQLPAAMAATRVGNGYVQQLLGTGASPASYLVTVADGSAAGYVVTGAILARFLALGGPAGMLGYPQSDATAGGRQTFQAGALAGNPVQLVSGAILTKWGTLGYETGVGSPTAPAGNFQTFRGTAGTQQAFDNALILAPTIGPLAGRVFAVTGLILAQYSAAGGPGGDLGSPTGDEIPVNGLRQQSFEGGSASYAPGATSATVTITPRQPLVTAAPASVLSGSTVHLVAGGFDNGAMVRVSQTGQPDFTVTVANGAYTWDVHVPTSAANGVVVVRAIDVNRNLTAQAAYSIANAASALLRMSVVGGDQQTGPPGAQLGQPLVVSVTDQNGNPAPGQAVTFAASPGASVTPTTSVTDSNGQASAALRLPASEGVAIASASAVHLVVSFSARAAALSLSNFPALTQTVDGTLDNGSDTIRKKGAMVTAAASVLRHYQLRNLLPQPNGLADPASLNQFLKSFCVTDGNGNKTCDGFVTLGQSTEQTVNLWRVGAFAGNQVDVRIEDAGLGHVRDLLAGGYPVLLSLSLSGLGAHFVTAMGVAPDGSILIADPDPGYGQTNLNGYLNGFTAAGIGVKGSLTGAVRLVPQPPAAAGFLVYANAPISISSAGGNCGPALDFPDTAAVAGAVPSSPPGEIYFHPCAGSAAAYQVDIAATAAFHAKFADLSSNGGSAGLDGSGPTSAQVLPTGQNWGVAPLALSITAPGVVNGASLTSDLAPGSYISIFGTGLAGASVQINGEPVAITAASPFLINTQMPLDIAPGAATVMLNSALGSAQQTATIGQTAPAIFSTSPGQAAIANQDNSANTPSNPALRGSWIVIYATGLGQVSGAGTAQPANVPVSVVIGGAETPAGYAGIAPASTPGVYQVNVQLPAGLPPGLSLPLYLRQGGAVSNTVAVAVQ